MRIALSLEYDGTAYHGWQKQAAVSSIQGQLEQALTQIADHPLQVTCAGRTDAGVHALEQVVHFDTSARRAERAWVMGANTHLPGDIRVLHAQEVAEDFHARYSATARQYHYVIYNYPIRSAILRHRAVHFPWDLDENTMSAAGQYLLGEHDFTSYRGIDCQSKTPYRRVLHLHIYRRGRFVIIDIKANAFLHHMVRNIAGVLMEIGAAKRDPSWSKAVLESRDRTVGGITAPAEGLYLTSVEYPTQFGIQSALKTPGKKWYEVFE